MRSPIDDKFLRNVKTLRESHTLVRHTGERFNFSVKLLSEVSRHIVNHMQEIKVGSIHANISRIDYYLQVFKDNNTYFDALVLNSHCACNIYAFKDDQPCNLLTINRAYKDSQILIQGHTLYKAEDSAVSFFFRHLDIFLQEMERLTISQILRLSASASFLNNSISFLQGAKYSERSILT